MSCQVLKWSYFYYPQQLNSQVRVVYLLALFFTQYGTTKYLLSEGGFLSENRTGLDMSQISQCLSSKCQGFLECLCMYVSLELSSIYSHIFIIIVLFSLSAATYICTTKRSKLPGSQLECGYYATYICCHLLTFICSWLV